MSEALLDVAAWGISRDPLSRLSFDDLSEQHKAVADGLAADLVALVEQYPNRVSTGQRICFYRHPDPLLEVGYVIDRGSLTYIIKHFKAPLPPLTTGFVSYSHKDEDFFRDFRDHVSILHANGYLTFWSDKEIEPGSDWERQIRDAIERSGLAVLLVTPRFIASKFIMYDELPLILLKRRDRGMDVFRIPVVACDIAGTGLEAIQAICDDGKPLKSIPKARRDSVMKEIVQALRLKLEGKRGTL